MFLPANWDIFSLLCQFYVYKNAYSVLMYVFVLKQPPQADIIDIL